MNMEDFRREIDMWNDDMAGEMMEAARQEVLSVR
jgi:hypothetical protein